MERNCILGDRGGMRLSLCLCVVSVYKWSGISTVSEDSLPSMHEHVSLLEKAEISPVFGKPLGA